MAKTAFESIKAGLLGAIQHQRGERSDIVVTNPKATNRLDAKRETDPISCHFALLLT